MKLIDRIMRDICAEMEWGYFEVPEPGSWSYDIKAKLTPVVDAVDDVVQAARAMVDSCVGADGFELPPARSSVEKAKDALAALDEVRGE